MLLNDDLNIPATIHAAEMDWVPSPTAGVDRRMLFRIGEEKARATSIVRYAPQSRFPRHAHPGGEEFIVLEGTFQDESGDFPAGTYVRNPPGSSHAPGSEGGCTIFVKLWQFRADDQERIVMLPGAGLPQPTAAGCRSSLMLFQNGHEVVRLAAWEPNAEISADNPEGLELLVLSGGFTREGEAFAAQSWLRLPTGQGLRAHAGSDGVVIWMKHGKLLQDNVVQFA